MNNDRQKAEVFIKRLLMNPALQYYEILQKEEQILTFLNTNSQSLFPALSSEQFFPNKTWQQIFAILYNSLTSQINEVLFKELEAILNNINYTFIGLLRQTTCPLSQCRDQILTFEKKLLNKYEARNAFNGSLTALKLNIIDKYIEQIFQRREYIHFELTKVQRLKMGSEEIKNFIKVSMILKNAIHLVTVGTANLSIESVMDIVQRAFADKVNRMLEEELRLLPPELIASAVNSNISFLENKNMETTSRIISIFTMRCKYYKPYNTVDRGAETPDKSWFNIARRNYKFYGFDIKMLDEFYKIAAEHNW
ncbi:MAG: hypothetical protein JXB88_03495 [Spirochaetales bacterium]|nr:hypothetical protein [Spirochaetales bacterium]